MKLILTQPEIEAILRAHVNATVQLTSGSDYNIEFTATRSDSGMTATIDIPYMGVASIPAIVSANNSSSAPEAATPVPDAPTPRGPGRPKGSKNATSLLGGAASAPTPVAVAAAQSTTAGSLLGGGLIPASQPIQNPAPVEADQAEEAEAEEAEAEEAQEATETAAEPAAETSAPVAPAEPAPAPKKSPSLFGN